MPIDVSIPENKASCCAPSQCWNGTICIDNQKANPSSLPLTSTNFRCIDGDWKSATLKYTPDGSKAGYCPQENQCLVDPLAKNESLQCINSGEHIDDYNCENGDWKSRTSILALELLKLKSGDFVLFCDSKDSTLNYLQYQVGSKTANAILDSDLKAKNFCVLKNSDKVIVGSTITSNNISQGSFAVFGAANCNL